MDDHDQRFKGLLTSFFADFLALFFPAWAARFDLDAVEWLDKEVFLDPPQGLKRELDLVARLRLHEPEQGQTIALVHVEVESADKVNVFRGRMHEYYRALRPRYGLPVLPIALYLRVGLGGIGWDEYEETFAGETIVRFRFLYVGLPALDAEDYARGDNWLGVALAALMRVPKERQAVLKAEVMDRLVKSPLNEAKKYLLAECADAYFPLEGGQATEYERLKAQEPHREAHMAYVGWKDQGKQELLRKQLEQRFGPLSPGSLQKLATLTGGRLDEIGLKYVQAESLRALGLEDEPQSEGTAAP